MNPVGIDGIYNFGYLFYLSSDITTSITLSWEGN
jgi:hypothetical protein